MIDLFHEKNGNKSYLSHLKLCYRLSKKGLQLISCSFRKQGVKGSILKLYSNKIGICISLCIGSL